MPRKTSAPTKSQIRKAARKATKTHGSSAVTPSWVPPPIAAPAPRRAPQICPVCKKSWFGHGRARCG